MEPASRTKAEQVEAYRNRAKRFALQGDFDQAKAELDAALQLDPRDIEAYAERALVHIACDRTERAIADLNRAIALGPERFELYLVRGRAYAEQGYFEC